jgi:endogenous inhibitor of DNA gyrase (YacG/DUF329 family)
MINMKICKNCEERPAEKYSKYTTGEFCSKECARGFSTKLKRKEISEQVSKTLTGSGHGDITKNCPTCKNDFTLEFRRRHREHCSPKCANNNPRVKKTISKAVSAVKSGRVPVGNTKAEKARKERLNKWNEENKYQK